MQQSQLQQQQQQRRRKKRQNHMLKMVEVMRGRNGYGFTISGQHPCILSCIVSGSPADRMGLRTGDFLFSVNNQDVSRASHDDVVRMIGSSRGALYLQISENFNSSESSDDDLHNRPRSKYPHRSRLRPPGSGQSMDDSVLYSKRQSGSKTRIDDNYAKLRALSPGREIERQQRKDKYDIRSMGIENVDPLSSRDSAMYQKGRQKHMSANEGIIRYRSPNTKHTIITREARLGSLPKSQSNPEGFQQAMAPPGFGSDSSSSQAMSGRRREVMRRPPEPLIQEEESGLSLEVEGAMLGEYLRVIVGYVGTVGMARDSRNDVARVQSIRNAVHRLKVERKLTTMVLMEVAINGIRLINTMGSTVALYAAEHIAFSGIHAEDKRFFGIVTVHIEPNEDFQMEQDDVSDSSCHVFKVSPELCSHRLHVHKIQNFGIHCTPHPETQQCMEFPSSAVPIMKCMSRLYKERPSALYESEMAQIGAFSRPNFVPQRQDSMSSVSDSGVGNGFRPPSAKLGADRVCVVEMQQRDASLHSDLSLRWEGEPNVTPSYNFGDPNISAILPCDNMAGSGALTNQQSLATATLNSSSSSSQESPVRAYNTTERLNVRAMPPPRHQQQFSREHMEQQTSAANIRRSIHRIIGSRQHNQGEGSESVVSNQNKNENPYGELRSLMLHGPQSHEELASCDSSFFVSNVGNSRPDVSAISAISTDTSTGSFDSSQSLTPNITPNASWARPPRPVSYPNRPVPAPPSFPLPPLPKDKPPLPDRQPPLPERQPIIPRKIPKTPVRVPPAAERPRPRSTPPFKQVKKDVVSDEEDEDGNNSGYESEPGSAVEGETWSTEVPKKQPVIVNRPGPGEPRRFSEGYALTKQEKQMPEKCKKSGSFHQKTDKPFRRTTISNSHESLVAPENNLRGQANGTRLNAATSVTTINNKGVVVRQTNGSVETVGRAASWAVSFEKLLRDPHGLQIFTDFLKKEFSEENLIFWKKCDDFRKITDSAERSRKAQELFSRHLSSVASEPVNVDSTARQTADKGLSQADSTLFYVAQHQIFQLMKQDSYARFLKSDGYKSCVVAEMEGKPLPVKDTGETKIKAMPPSPSEKWKKTLKKSKSSSVTEDPGEEKRRRSLLPWSKKDKGDKKITKNLTHPDLHSAPGSTAQPEQAAQSNTLPRMKQLALKEVDPTAVAPRDSHRYLRVTLPDGSATVIPAQSGRTILEAVVELCQRRGLCLAAVDVVLAGDGQVLDLSQDLSTLASKELRLEKCAVFRVDLPQKRYLCVRAKASQTIAPVFRPLLHKYNMDLDSGLVLHVAGTGVILGEHHDIASLEHKQVLVQSLDDFKEWGSYGSHRSSTSAAKPPIPRPRGTSSSVDPYRTARTLEDVVGLLFKDVLDASGSVDEGLVKFDECGVWDFSKHKMEENRTSGILGFIRRNSIGEKDAAKMPKQKSHKIFGSVRQLNTKPSNNNPGAAVPPPPSNGRGKRFDADDERLFELLSRAQSRQMDDQRGLTAKDFELPEFLRVSDHPQTARETSSRQSEFAVPKSVPIARPRSAPRLTDDDPGPTPDSGRASTIGRPPSYSAHQQLEQGLLTPRSAKLANPMDFGHDGVMPTPNRAMNYFMDDFGPVSPDFNDSKLADKSLSDIGFSNQGQSYVGFRDRAAPVPCVPRRQNPPAVQPSASQPQKSTRPRLTPNQSSEEDLDITLIPPSDSSSEADCLPSPPHEHNRSCLDDTERAEFSPPTPLIRGRTNQDIKQNSHRNNGHIAQRPTAFRSEMVVHRPRSESDRFTHCSDTSSRECTRSTPSPTTHDLILDFESASETQSVCDSVSSFPSSSNVFPVPAERNMHNNQHHSEVPQLKKAKKSLAFDEQEPKVEGQISFV